MLTQEELAGRAASLSFHKHTILIDDPAVSAESGRNLEIAAEPDDLAYIMYTAPPAFKTASIAMTISGERRNKRATGSPRPTFFLRKRCATLFAFSFNSRPDDSPMV